MRDAKPATIRMLLDRLLAARARRDREERFSEPWRAADHDMHELETEIFRVPPEPPRRSARPLPAAVRLRRAD
jgi:hypothetical protein